MHMHVKMQKRLQFLTVRHKTIFSNVYLIFDIYLVGERHKVKKNLFFFVVVANSRVQVTRLPKSE